MDPREDPRTIGQVDSKEEFTQIITALLSNFEACGNKKLTQKEVLAAITSLSTLQTIHMKALQDKIEILNRNAELYQKIILLQDDKAQAQTEMNNKNSELLQKVVNLQEEKAQTSRQVPFSTDQPDVTHKAAMKEVIEEYRDADERQRSLVIRGIPEEKGINREQRERAEGAKIKKLFDDALDVKDAKITLIRRMGPYREDNERPRPMQVTLSNIWTRRTICAKAHLLRDMEEWNLIYVNSMQTKEERLKSFEKKAGKKS